jgi:hypothetical protein
MNHGYWSADSDVFVLATAEGEFELFCQGDSHKSEAMFTSAVALIKELEQLRDFGRKIPEELLRSQTYDPKSSAREAQPCPHIVSSKEGTSYCDLDAQNFALGATEALDQAARICLEIAQGPITGAAITGRLQVIGIRQGAELCANAIKKLKETRNERAT